jgi:hypothetical protein
MMRRPFRLLCPSHQDIGAAQCLCSPLEAKHIVEVNYWPGAGIGSGALFGVLR